MITYQRQVGRDELPEDLVYDPDRLELHFGQGVFGPVSLFRPDRYAEAEEFMVKGWFTRAAV